MKKEFKIGEVFQYGLKQLKCVKAPCENRKCYVCALYHDLEDMCLGCGFIGECERRYRADKTDVIFVKVDEI